MYKRTDLIRLVAAAAPAASFAFSLYVHDDFHAAVFEELDGAYAHVFEICGVRGDDVDDAEDALFVRGVRMVMVVVVVIVRMRVRMGVVMAMIVRVVM
jgi:hypothetical protein